MEGRCCWGRHMGNTRRENRDGERGCSVGREGCRCGWGERQARPRGLGFGERRENLDMGGLGWGKSDGGAGTSISSRAETRGAGRADVAESCCHRLAGKGT